MSRTSDRRYRRNRETLKRSSDGDVCAVCLGPIDMDLRFPHPDSWSADHIIPVSTTDNPIWSNRHGALQASHLRCNRERGDGRRHQPPVRHSRQW